MFGHGHYFAERHALPTRLGDKSGAQTMRGPIPGKAGQFRPPLHDARDLIGSETGTNSIAPTHATEEGTRVDPSLLKPSPNGRDRLIAQRLFAPDAAGIGLSGAQRIGPGAVIDDPQVADLERHELGPAPPTAAPGHQQQGTVPHAAEAIGARRQ